MHSDTKNYIAGLKAGDGIVKAYLDNIAGEQSTAARIERAMLRQIGAALRLRLMRKKASPMPRCRHCKLYDLDAVKNARGAVMGDRAGACGWSPRALPESMRSFYGDFSKLQKGYMPPNEIHRCATFVPREN